MTKSMRHQLSAAFAALTAFVFLGCMGQSSGNTSTCTAADRPRPAQYADLSASGADFGTVTVGDTGTATVTISNTGNQGTSSFSVAPLPPPFAYSGGSYPGTGGTCGAAIAAQQRCQLGVTFSPSETSTNSAAVEIRYLPPPYADVTQGSARIWLSGTARRTTYADLTGPATVEFGGIQVGTDATKIITVTNKGNVVATGIAIDGVSCVGCTPLPQPPFSYAGGSFPGVGGTCGASLEAGASCALAITFSPTVAGFAYSAIGLRYTPGPYTVAAEGRLSVSLYGTGTNVALAPAAYDFGSIPVSSTASAEFTLTNSTTAAIPVSCWAFSPVPYGYRFKGGTCCGGSATANGSSQLGAGNACTLIVEFAPPSVGHFEDSFGFSLTPCSPTVCAWSNTVTVTGEGT